VEYVGYVRYVGYVGYMAQGLVPGGTWEYVGYVGLCGDPWSTWGT